MISRGFPTVLASDLPAMKDWYTGLLDWDTEFDSDWFVHLKAPAAPGVELGILAADHEIVPAGLALNPMGVLLTIVVDDVDDTHAQAQRLGHDIVEEPRDLFYGQRRMILRDPTGLLVDVSSDCEPSAEFVASLSHRSEH